MDVTPGCCLTLDAFMCTFFSRFVHVSGEEGPHMRYPKNRRNESVHSHPTKADLPTLPLHFGSARSPF